MRFGVRTLALSVATSTLMLVGVATAEPVTVAPLMTKNLVGAPGREVQVITVEYAPGAGDPIHRHHAQAFVYVLEGSIEMQVKGGELVTLTSSAATRAARSAQSSSWSSSRIRALRCWCPNRNDKRS